MGKRTRHIPDVFYITLLALLSVAGCREGSYRDGKMLLESGDFEAARECYLVLVKQDPRDFAAHYGLGMSYCAEAIYKTEIGLAVPNDWYPAIYQMTVAAHLSENEHVRQTLAILHFNLGAAYRKIDNREDAISRIEQAVAYDSSLIKAYNLLGALYHESGQFDKAEQCYRRTLILKPDYAMAHFNLGALFWARGDYTAAAQQFQDAQTLAPQNNLFNMWFEKARVEAGKH